MYKRKKRLYNIIKKGVFMKEQLLQDLKDAMKEKDIIKKNTITMLRAAILQVEDRKSVV